MFIITVQSSFRASHQLTLYDGSKEAVHEHNWQVKAAAVSEKLDKCGMVMDFNVLRKKLDSITAEFADVRLEDIFEPLGKNASAEIIAEYIYQKLARLLPKHVLIEYTEVTEQPGCSAVYRK